MKLDWIAYVLAAAFMALVLLMANKTVGGELKKYILSNEPQVRICFEEKALDLIPYSDCFTVNRDELKLWAIEADVKPDPTPPLPPQPIPTPAE